MLTNVKLLDTMSALASYSAQRHAVIADNIANADTPGFRAQDIAPFEEAMQNTPIEMRKTRPGHVSGGNTSFAARITTTESEASPNGNTVALEDELLKSVSISRDHDKALSIYRHAMTVLRTSLGKI